MKVELEEYNAEWPERFEQERAFLLEIIGTWLVGSVEHVGSTAVRGMVAKPIIDIMFGVKDLESSKGAIEILQSNGYCYYPYKSEVMHWFCKPSPEFRTHHLHLVPYQSPLWQERITFRNMLTQSPKLAGEYAELKKSLAAEVAYDREAYTQKKWPFIKKVLSRAKNC
ncbi:GrpB family protein [Marinimicrobium agarilyticum]|uniref:GrpB family protein n=1 Tax=Marinimicrobium agarilyticum TaxID=306546 RepID=UPI0006861573|nr:GrpB family protein [Marinimicrobium agarilyticum]